MVVTPHGVSATVIGGIETRDAAKIRQCRIRPHNKELSDFKYHSAKV